MSQARAVCPICGNDRIVQATSADSGRLERRSYCAGSLGCFTWWDPATLAPVPPPSRSGFDVGARVGFMLT